MPTETGRFLSRALASACYANTIPLLEFKPPHKRQCPAETYRNLYTDLSFSPFNSSSWPPPARQPVLAPFHTYTYPPPFRGDNDLQMPAGPHSEYGTRDTLTSTASHYEYGTDITQIVSNRYRKQMTVTAKIYRNRKDTKSQHRR